MQPDSNGDRWVRRKGGKVLSVTHSCSHLHEVATIDLIQRRSSIASSVNVHWKEN